MTFWIDADGGVFIFIHPTSRLKKPADCLPFPVAAFAILDALADEMVYSTRRAGKDCRRPVRAGECDAMTTFNDVFDAARLCPSQISYV